MQASASERKWFRLSSHAFKDLHLGGGGLVWGTCPKVHFLSGTRGQTRNKQASHYVYKGTEAWRNQCLAYKWHLVFAADAREYEVTVAEKSILKEKNYRC